MTRWPIITQTGTKVIVQFAHARTVIDKIDNRTIVSMYKADKLVVRHIHEP